MTKKELAVYMKSDEYKKSRQKALDRMRPYLMKAFDACARCPLWGTKACYGNNCEKTNRIMRPWRSALAIRRALYPKGKEDTC